MFRSQKDLVPVTFCSVPNVGECYTLIKMRSLSVQNV
jgi:hypothetical protein